MKNVHVITGGSSGIGLECAKRFKDGVVLITGRNEDKLKSAELELKEAVGKSDIAKNDAGTQKILQEVEQMKKENTSLDAAVSTLIKTARNLEISNLNNKNQPPAEQETDD